MSRLTDASKAFWDTLVRAEAAQLSQAGRAVASQTDVSKLTDPNRGMSGFGQAGPLPADVRDSMSQQGMTTGGPFSPGKPMQQFSPWDMPPRVFDLQTGYNVATRPRSGTGRLSFWTMQNVLMAWDVARICIEHLEDDIRSFDWEILPADGVEENVKDQCALGRKFLEKPDGAMPLDSWLNAFLEDVLRYDAGTIFKDRKRNGTLGALTVLSGPMIAPLIDYWGRVPKPPAPGYVQYANGVPWVWLDTNDLIYQPYRPIPESLYGLPPIEWLLLNANTDIRFQWHFLQWFTEGTLPDTFMEAPPDMSEPEEILKLQNVWDAVMEGDQAMKHKVKWIPSGSKPVPASVKTFDEKFPLYLMRKTCAAFKVVPADIGITDSVNKASSETQVDVQFRTGTSPRLNYVAGILTRVLQNDLHLPCKFNFDTGREKEDRFQEAQAMDMYVKMGALSPDEVRKNVLNLPVDSEFPTPRFIFSARAGAIPLKSITEIAGKIDPLTTTVEGGTVDETLGDKIRGQSGADVTPTGTSAMPTDLKSMAIKGSQPPAVPGKPGGAPVAGQQKEATATGVGAAPAQRSELVRELKNWQSNSLKRVESGRKPRLFESEILPSELVSVVWAKLRRAASEEEVQDAFRLPFGGWVLAEPLVAGLAVRANDTGRVLLIQRANDPEDSAAGKWEFPGGHLEDDEASYDAAKREWTEETGCALPDGEVVGSWLDPSGIYECWVYLIASEDLVPNNPDPENRDVLNPDDPDHDNVEVFAWFDPRDMRGNPSMREEMKTADWDVLQFAGEFERYNPNHGEGGRFASGEGGLKANRDSLPLNQQKSIDAYSYYDGAKQINTYLRDGITPPGIPATDFGSEVVNPEVQNPERMIANIDAAMSSSRTSEDMTTFRGVSGAYGSQLNALPVGATFTDKGYASTSLNSRSDFMDRGTNLAIQIPAGSNAMLLGNGEDREVLLPRGSTFQVVSNDGSGRIVVQLSGKVARSLEVGLERYNPNHGEGGRFSEGTSFIGTGKGRGGSTNVLNPVTGEPLTKTGVGKLGAKVFQEKVAPDLEKRLGGKLSYLSAGNQERAPLDFKFGNRTGVELKTISSTSGSQKTAMSLDEIGRKEGALRDLGLRQGATILQVLDVGRAKVDVYYSKGFVSRSKAGMEHIGTYSMKSQLASL